MIFPLPFSFLALLGFQICSESASLMDHTYAVLHTGTNEDDQISISVH